MPLVLPAAIRTSRVLARVMVYCLRLVVSFSNAADSCLLKISLFLNTLIPSVNISVIIVVGAEVVAPWVASVAP